MSVDARIGSSFRFDGRSFVGLALAPKKPFDDWLAALDGWIGRSWIFTSRPIIIDFSNVKPTQAELTRLLSELRARGLRVVAVEGVDEDWFAGLPGPFPPGFSAATAPLGAEARGTTASAGAGGIEPAEVKGSSAPPAGLLIEQQVRSGETISYPEGDVTVLGSIASGAEVIAGGSIHVYGTLRGRAIAGNHNNPKARLFCRRFEPELIAINGLYCTADEVDPALRAQPVQAWLEGNTINMAILD